MHALRLDEPRHWRMIEQPEPSEPSVGEALVRVHRVGLCGTDYSGYLGKMPFFSYPRIPGHELGVEVVAIGSGVNTMAVGDRCAVEPYINCQNCYSCARGHTNCCVNHQTLGVHCDGGLRPYFMVPARKLHISRTLTYEQLALVETLGIGCHAVNRARPSAAETVLVIGAGPIGLSVIEFAKLSGARTIVMDTNPQRLAFVRDVMQVPEILTVDGNELEAFEAMTNGNLADVVVDATGSNVSMSAAYNFVAFAGRLVWVGITSQELKFMQPLMHRRELSFLASRNALSGDFKRIIELIETQKLNTNPWITHRLGFHEVIGSFETLLKPETGVIKAVVELTA